jgi:hypothetical protein
MQTWTGWTTAGTTTKGALTWAEWCNKQCVMYQEQRKEERQSERMPFTERERARLSFMRWLYLTGHLDLQDSMVSESETS